MDAYKGDGGKAMTCSDFEILTKFSLSFIIKTKVNFIFPGDLKL